MGSILHSLLKDIKDRELLLDFACLYAVFDEFFLLFSDG